jgi:biopolymer transport protein ExbD
MRTLTTLLVCAAIYQFAWAAAPEAVGCPSDNVVRVSASDTCRFDGVEVACNSIGKRLRALHVALSCDIHVNVDHLSTFDVVKGALQSLKDAGYIKVGFVNLEGK